MIVLPFLLETKKLSSSAARPPANLIENDLFFLIPVVLWRFPTLEVNHNPHVKQE